jgi:tetratricopeptide (TPR) repeat protein
VFVAYGPLGSISGKDLQSDLTAAEALFAQSRWDAAIGAYKAILEKAPPLTSIHLQIAAAYRNKQDYAEAASAYNALLKVDPDNDKATVGLATISLERGDAAAAEEVLSKAAEREGAGREVFFTLAEMRLAKSDLADAVRWYGSLLG